MKNILIVDDEKEIREMVKDMLIRDGLNIELACSGVKAMESLSKNHFDLVITDIVMPDENGIDLIMDIKKQYSNIPVIAMSGGGGIEGRFDYLEIAKLIGANCILKKPFSLELLTGSVNELIAE